MGTYSANYRYYNADHTTEWYYVRYRCHWDKQVLCETLHSVWYSTLKKWCCFPLLPGIFLDKYLYVVLRYEILSLISVTRMPCNTDKTKGIKTLTATCDNSM